MPPDDECFEEPHNTRVSRAFGEGRVSSGQLTGNVVDTLHSEQLLVPALRLAGGIGRR